MKAEYKLGIFSILILAFAMAGAYAMPVKSHAFFALPYAKAVVAGLGGLALFLCSKGLSYILKIKDGKDD